MKLRHNPKFLKLKNVKRNKLKSAFRTDTLFKAQLNELNLGKERKIKEKELLQN